MHDSNDSNGFKYALLRGLCWGCRFATQCGVEAQRSCLYAEDVVF